MGRDAALSPADGKHLPEELPPEAVCGCVFAAWKEFEAVALEAGGGEQEPAAAALNGGGDGAVGELLQVIAGGVEGGVLASVVGGGVEGQVACAGGRLRGTCGGDGTICILYLCCSPRPRIGRICMMKTLLF